MQIHVTFDFGNEKSPTFTLGEPEAKAKVTVPTGRQVRGRAGAAFRGIQQRRIGDLREEAEALGINTSKLGRQKCLILALINEAKAKAGVQQAATGIKTREHQEEARVGARKKQGGKNPTAPAPQEVPSALAGMNVGEAINRLFRFLALADQSEVLLRAAEKQLAKIKDLRAYAD